MKPLFEELLEQVREKRDVLPGQEANEKRYDLYQATEYEYDRLILTLT